MMSDDVSFVFVYGTLLEGAPNHARFCADALTIEPAVTTGRLYHLPQGYPAMIEADDGQVHGEAMIFPDLVVTLRGTDSLEGYDPAHPWRSLYRRITRPIMLLSSGKRVLAWTYVWNGALPAGAILMPHGCWHFKRVLQQGAGTRCPYGIQ